MSNAEQAPRDWTAPQPAPDERVAHLPVAAIAPNPHQPRRHFAADTIAELAASIHSQGLLQPLIVRERPGHAGAYELVAGERRLRAVRSLGWEAVPAIVRALDDTALLEAALVENLQREALGPMEEAAAYRTLLQRHGYTQDALARRVGKDRSTIANMLRLLALTPGVQEALQAGRLSVGHARALLAVSDPADQAAYGRMVAEQGLSVRATERLVSRGRNGQAGAPAAPAQPAPPEDAEARQYEAARETLERRLATRVAVQRDAAGAGRIEIDFYDTEDFNRIHALLLAR